MVRRRRQQRAYPAIKGVKLARAFIMQDIELYVKGHPPRIKYRSSLHLYLKLPVFGRLNGEYWFILINFQYGLC